MGNNASSGAATTSTTLTDGRFFAGRRVEFTLANFRQLHAQLLDFAHLPPAEIVELLRVLSEFLIYSDQHRGRASPSVEGPSDSTGSGPVSENGQGAAAFFDYFGEKNVLALLVDMGASSPSVPVQIQLLQTLSILVQNIATRTSLYYILSNNYINKLLECPFQFEHDDVRDWYVTLLKALSLRLNEETVQFFFDSATARFPLYARALRFGRCKDNMIKVAVKTLTLNVLRVPDERVRSFILHYDELKYFRDIVEYANDVALKIQGLLNEWPETTRVPAATSALTEKLEEAIDEYIDHCFYLQDILDVNVPELCYKVGEFLYTLHVRTLLAASVLPNCNPPPQRVSTRLALYLLTRMLGILEYAPLVNAVAFMLLSPDAAEPFAYSSVALGAGSRRRSKRPSMKKRGSRSKSRNGSGAPLFRAHSASECDSPLCYLQTRFAMGEWPVKEVEQFATVSDEPNCFRASMVTLLESSDERLSSTALLLVLSIVNNSSADHSLLRELGLLPLRYHSYKHIDNEMDEGSTASEHANGDDNVLGDEEDDIEEQATVTSASSSSASSRSNSADNSQPIAEQMSERTDDTKATDDPNQDDVLTITTKAKKCCICSKSFNPLRHRHVCRWCGSIVCGSCSSSRRSPEEKTGGSTRTCTNCTVSSSGAVYPQWLIDTALTVLSRNPSTRLLSVELCVRLILDIVYDPRAAPPHSLTAAHAATLKELHSASTHLVMESMRGSMSDVDLFIYVLEDEFGAFQKATFPMALNLQASAPFDFVVPLPAQDKELAAAVARFTVRKTPMLSLREPVNEMEVCRKSMRIFLVLRRLRELVDRRCRPDRLEQFAAFRHPHTEVLVSAASLSKPAPVDGMVMLPCTWREHRFLLSPTKLLMVLNPETVAFVERVGGNDDEANEAAVRLLAPMHRTYCSIDGKDDRVLHLSVSSTIPVLGCRSSDEYSGSSRDHDGPLHSWQASVLFGNSEDCSQAQAHIDLCRAEVRAFKLTQIEESLSMHAQVTPSSKSGRKHVRSRKQVASGHDVERGGDEDKRRN